MSKIDITNEVTILFSQVLTVKFKCSQNHKKYKLFSIVKNV